MCDATKICKVCKRTLPLAAFKKNAKSKDGYAYVCKSCSSGKLSTNPVLAEFSPKQLLEELAARGYHGTLTFIETHKLSV